MAMTKKCLANNCLKDFLNAKLGSLNHNGLLLHSGHFYETPCTSPSFKSTKCKVQYVY